MKVAHVHIPKTAGGSVNQWFKKYTPESLVFGTHKTIDKCTKEFDFSFCIVRNTYHRLISSYEFAKSVSLEKYKKRLNKGNAQDAISSLEMMEHIDKGIIPWLKYNIDRDANTFWPLDRWTKDVDIVLHQENLTEDFYQIQEKLNCFKPLEKTHHVLQYNKTQYLTKEYVDFVYKYFYKEIDKYNYKV